MGYQAIVINNNPATISTDYKISDKLYIEPLTIENIMNVIHFEKPEGVVITFGGQTALDLCSDLTDLKVPIIDTKLHIIEHTKNREMFQKIVRDINIPKTQNKIVTAKEQGIKEAEDMGYPILVRSNINSENNVTKIIHSKEAFQNNWQIEISPNKPALIQKYIEGIEVEVDAISDGENVFIPGIIQHIEKTGIHSGDSISVYPGFSISEEARQKIVGYTVQLGIELGIVGLYKIQYIITKRDHVYIIELNPRASRTAPFMTKASGYPLVELATKVILGKNLRELGVGLVYPEQPDRWYVKAPTFSFAKLAGVDAYLSPEMKSTGKAIGYDDKLTRALYKALQASNLNVSNFGTIFVTIDDRDKYKALPLIKRFYNLGFNIEATEGTANFLKENDIRTRVRAKISEGSDEILESIRQGYVTYIINTRNPDSDKQLTDGYIIRRCAAKYNVTTFTSLDTVSVLLDVLEEITIGVSTIDSDKQDQN